MKPEFEEYRPRKIVNVHKHADGPWFWNRYSAHPYVGCCAGCEFCYSRSRRYLGGRDPGSYDSHIRVKTNAPELLRKELSPLEPDILACGDWQMPAESRYCLSRRMLEVALEHGFPVVVIERSPLLVRDVDLLKRIDDETWAGVIYSISSLDPDIKTAFEPRSPSVESRLRAMEELSGAGIEVGTAMMPIIPFLGDDEGRLEEVVEATRDHGGGFVLAGGLTMEGEQARRTLAAAEGLDPAIVPLIREMYGWTESGKPSDGPPDEYSARIGRLVRDLCRRHGLDYRMPRFMLPGPLAVNKWLAERLFLESYDLELEEAGKHRVWAYRKAAWQVDDHPENIECIHREEGLNGIRNIEGIGASISRRMAEWLSEWTQTELARRSTPI
jgi:DNA repair photolyase